MAKRMPELPDTGRHYLDETRRARLASPGIERYVAARGRGSGPLLAAGLLLAALVAAFVWLSS